MVPFDDLFILGLERDNDLWMRAHIGTSHGRKGSAPLGRNYALFNWDDFKTVYHNGFLSLERGRFWIPARSPIHQAILDHGAGCLMPVLKSKWRFWEPLPLNSSWAGTCGQVIMPFMPPPRSKRVDRALGVRYSDPKGARSLAPAQRHPHLSRVSTGRASRWSLD